MRPRLKICCIASLAEAQLAIRHGADALGLVASMPSGPGVIDDAAIAAIAKAAPPGVATFLLTSRVVATEIAAHVRATGANTAQIVSHVDAGEYPALRAALPGVKLVQVVHVEDEGALALALRYAPLVDALLLDSGRPSAAELGGTGRTHDWAVSRRIVDAVAPLPVFLAGGLDAENLLAAWRHVRPFGFDLCTRLRTGGALDAAKLARFMTVMRSLPA